MGPPGPGKIKQNNFPLGMELAEPAGRGKIGPRSEASQFSVCLPAYSLSREIAHERSLLGAVNSPICWTRAGHVVVPSIWRTRLVHFPGWCCKNKSA